LVARSWGEFRKVSGIGQKGKKKHNQFLAR